MPTSFSGQDRRPNWKFDPSKATFFSINVSDSSHELLTLHDAQLGPR